jgi:hypothetical protein
MFILQKKNSILLFILLSACELFAPVEPVARINNNFKSNYGNFVKKAKKNHEEAFAKAGYTGVPSFGNTAYGRLKQTELDFLEKNMENKPYFEAENAGPGNLIYNSYNSGEYNTDYNEDIFADIKIPKNGFRHYDLGQKDYNGISNIEIQKSYDYIGAISKEQLKQIEIARLIEEENNKNKKDKMTDKVGKGLKKLTDKIKGLLK